MLCGPQRVGDYHETSSHRADVFTKPLERVKFQQACSMLGFQFSDRSREKSLPVCASVKDMSSTLHIADAESNDCLCMDRGHRGAREHIAAMPSTCPSGFFDLCTGGAQPLAFCFAWQPPKS
eukprot:551144-Amphidinium_carterae.2